MCKTKSIKVLSILAVPSSLLFASAATAQDICTGFDNLTVQSASSTFSNDESYVPENAIDNDLDTESRWSSEGIGNSIVFDLGRNSVVSQIDTAWYRADERTALFDVETSTDNSDWQIVASQASVTGTEGLVEVDVTDSVARYVRIVGQGNSSSEWNSIIELDVYGCVSAVDPGPVDPVIPAPPLPTPPPGPTTAPTPTPTPTPTPAPTTAGVPSDVLGESFFRKWNITVGDGSTVNNLVGYEDEDYFYNAGDDWAVFKSPNQGGTTPNSSNTRSELRQLQEWTPEEGGRMTATLQVMAVSTTADARFSPSFSTVVGQIHSNSGHKNEPLKIFYKKYPGQTKGSVFWTYEINTEGGNEGRWDISTAVWGDDWTVVGSSPTSYPPEPEDGIELGEEFSYEVVVENGIMNLTFESEGHPTRTFEKSLVDSDYASSIPDEIRNGPFGQIGQDGFEMENAYSGENQYFKLGQYNQTNAQSPEEAGAGAGGTTFWNTAGEGFGGDLDAQYANGSFAEVWFREATVRSNNDRPGVVNGDFENGIGAWGEIEPASSSGVAFNGAGAAKIEQPGGSISQVVEVLPGEDYTLSAAIRIDTESGGTVESNAGSASVLVDGRTIAIPTDREEANTYEVSTVTFNSGNSDTVTITFTGGDLRIDDVVLDGRFPELE